MPYHGGYVSSLEGRVPWIHTFTAIPRQVRTGDQQVENLSAIVKDLQDRYFDTPVEVIEENDDSGDVWEEKNTFRWRFWVLSFFFWQDVIES